MNAESFTRETLKSLMQYSFSTSEESMRWNGYTIETKRDEWAEAPHGRGDCMAPALWTYSDGGLNEDGGLDHKRILWDMKPAAVSRHWRKIAALLEISESTMESDRKAALRAFGRLSLSDWRQEYFAEALADIRGAATQSGRRSAEYLETLAALYMLQGVPAFTVESRGYCQGDLVAILVVLTPEWAARVGCPYAMPGKGRDLTACKRDAETQAAEIGAWIWGDVYGFKITDPDGQEVESCFGFYGSDPDESSIAEEIVSTLEHDRKRRAEAAAVAMAEDMAAARPDLAPCY